MSVDGQGTQCRRNIAENLNRLSRAHERYRRQTDGRQHIANVNVSSRSLKIILCKSSFTSYSPRSVTTPIILFDLLHINTIQTKKSCTANDNISKYREIRSLYPEHTPIFTVGSIIILQQLLF